MNRTSFFSCIALFFLTVSLQAMIFVDPAQDNNHNDGPPTGAYVDSGWQWQVSVSGAPGIIVSPNQVLTAAHNTSAGDTIWFQGNDYSGIPALSGLVGDLRLITVDTSTYGEFASWAPISYTPDISGEEIVVYGRGPGRSAELYPFGGGDLKGWTWSAPGSSRKLRWGTNVVDGYIEFGKFLVAFFSRGGSPHEAQLTVNDSGGAVMVFEDGEWKVAAINRAVSLYHSNNDSSDTPTNADGLLAAVFDTGGLWFGNDNDGWTYYPDQVEDILSSYFLSTTTAFYSSWLQENIILPEVIPEPTTASILFLASAFLLGRRKSHALSK